MPNWSFNKVALQGSKESVHQFIKVGLKNSNLESSNDISKDFDLLVKKALTKTSKKGEIGEVKEIVYEEWLSARTFLPMPDTFLTHDTTNYEKEFADIAKEQKKKYGAVGWYDYNCKTLGTKWNFTLEDAELIDLGNDKYRIIFTCNTAWSVPTEWLIAMSRIAPNLQVGIRAVEESNAYAFCGYVQDDDIADYEDITAELSDIYDAYDKKFNAHLAELKADKKVMESLREEAIESLKENGSVVITSDVIESVTNSHLTQRVYKDIGYPDDEETNAMEKLDVSFDTMLSEIMVA